MTVALVAFALAGLVLPWPLWLALDVVGPVVWGLIDPGSGPGESVPVTFAIGLLMVSALAMSGVGYGVRYLIRSAVEHVTERRT